MTLTLQQYCDKHGYEIVTEYVTLGDERLNHERAIVKNDANNETYYLYYDRSRRSGNFQYRGWRNTTLDNRRSRARKNKRQLHVDVIK